MHLQRAPSMVFAHYVQRLVDYMYCSAECFILAAVYAARLVAADAVPITPLTAHRVYGACLVVAVKVRDDHFYPMSYYAQVLGVPRAELCAMELFVIQALDYRTHVDHADYSAMVGAMLDSTDGADNSWVQFLVGPFPASWSQDTPSLVVSSQLA
jgi:hypothetical protein